jgi:formylglycine-generating enzyme required for sulfatase activity
MNCLTWYVAMAFCAWDGGYLPTEAEWNYAAAGGEQQRAYPWSVPADSLVVDSAHASYEQTDGQCLGDGMPDCTVTDLVPVGTKPAGDGRWGHSDLAGNVEEWVLDFPAPYVTPCIDCAKLDAKDPRDREIRGGNFFQGGGEFFLRNSTRYSYDPSFTNASVGARCARPAS